MKATTLVFLGATALTLVGGCAKHVPQTTAQDVEAAKQEAQQEVARARVEGAKDLKSAAKIGGGHSNDMARAKVIADFDVAMAMAEGDHKVAMTQCQTLQAPLIQACEDKANSDFEAAKSEAKVTRVARLQ